DRLLGFVQADYDLASWLMYPKVFADFTRHQRQYSDVSALPTPVFFNGLAEREEIAVAIDAGKTLAVRLTGRTEADDEGMVKLFFELNGQPRPIKVARAGQASAQRKHPKAEDGNPAHLPAPMPGAVAMVAVTAGQKVAKGTPLLSIEAMKMESVLSAERDATVAKVWVAPGDAVEAKDLLVEFELDA
ncbi:MAG TPA: pyruvate carboxylase, partial [Rubrivivax sp.]|nr:pyruvate carboxylase [Rubrivivax sp.]